jgi:hypothetical protein
MKKCTARTTGTMRKRRQATKSPTLSWKLEKYFGIVNVFLFVVPVIA